MSKLKTLIEETRYSSEIRELIGEVVIKMGSKKGQALADSIKKQNATAMTLAYEVGHREERERIANEIVDILPTGTLDAFAIIKAVQKYQQTLLTQDDTIS